MSSIKKINRTKCGSCHRDIGNVFIGAVPCYRCKTINIVENGVVVALKDKSFFNKDNFSMNI